MNTEEVVMEFVRSVENHRRFGTMLFRSIKGPKEKPHKVMMLADLKQTGKSRLKDIAAKVGQSPQNLCILYNSFEKDGLVLREVDPSDRRNTYYSITPKGSRLVEKNKGKAKEVIQDIFSDLSDKELKVLDKTLKQFNGMIEKILGQIS